MSPIFKCLICRKDIERSTKTFWIKKGHLLCSTCLDNIDKKKPFWDQDFTNTFIYFNSKIHSTYKNKKPAYNALLSIIFESSICEYNVGMSIEKRWAKWLILKSLVKN